MFGEESNLSYEFHEGEFKKDASEFIEAAFELGGLVTQNGPYGPYGPYSAEKSYENSWWTFDRPEDPFVSIRQNRWTTVALFKDQTSRRKMLAWVRRFG